MTSRPMTAAGMTNMGGVAKAKAHTKSELLGVGQVGRPAGKASAEAARNVEKPVGNRHDSG